MADQLMHDVSMVIVNSLEKCGMTDVSAISFGYSDTTKNGVITKGVSFQLIGDGELTSKENLEGFIRTSLFYKGIMVGKLDLARKSSCNRTVMSFDLSQLYFVRMSNTVN